MTTRITDTHDPDITVTLDSGSHINALAERPAKPVRSSRMLGGLGYKPGT